MRKIKVALVTILDNQNIGTYLQAFSLSNVIEKETNSEVEIVNYERKVSTRTSSVKRILAKNRNFFFKISSIIYRLFIPVIAKRRLKNFLKSNTKLTRKYTSFEEIKKMPPIAEVYLTGSDQVWNSNYNKGIDKVFYLDFAPKDKMRLSYAASIGMEEFPKHEIQTVKSLFKKYNKISVREKAAVNLLDKLDISNVEHVLDPTLLFTIKDWERVASKDDFKKTVPYLLIYSVEKNKKHIIMDCAKRVAKLKGLRIYSVTPEWFREGFRCDKNFYFSTPERFLNLFLNADFTIVSSFHGTAFSVNLNKQFFSVTPDKFNTRICSLLQAVKLEGRMIQNCNSLTDEYINNSIDYGRTNEIIDAERANSLKFLKGQIPKI